MSATTIRLYELAGVEDELRFSPYCWRVRLALLHKGQPFETVPWRFTEKDAIAFSGQSKVPVIVDGDRVVYDSWAIAEYLEDTYANCPSLFGGPSGKALSRFVTDWVETVLHPGILRLILVDVHAHLHQKDKDYFRRTREERFGMSLKDLCADREERIVSFRNDLTPLRPHSSTATLPCWAGASLGRLCNVQCFSVGSLCQSVSPPCERRHSLCLA